MHTFKIPPYLTIEQFKAKALNWAQHQSPICYLDNNKAQDNKYHRYEMLLGVGAHAEVSCSIAQNKAWQLLEQFKEKQGSCWIFNYLSYELKDELEQLHSRNPDQLGFPKLHAFVPQICIALLKDQCTVQIFGNTPTSIWQAILAQDELEAKALKEKPQIKARCSKADYLDILQKIKIHIIEGDIYEMNFCQEFFAEQLQLDPLNLYWRLNQLTTAPFSAYYQLNNHYLLSASPERFLYKEGQKLVSQPIKGTIKRGETEEEDLFLKATLLASEKDRAENVMIVDLVRNDLAKVSQIGSVQVEELFEIYSFKQVSQMISTVSSQLAAHQTSLDAIKATFPMGSMTGAPKVMSMRLIEHYENFRRGLYSAAVGYFNPEGDFDFNVVIRSLLYNSTKEYLSFQVGGAIVYDSDPELEYEECLLKAKGMLMALGIK